MEAGEDEDGEGGEGCGESVALDGGPAGAAVEDGEGAAEAELAGAGEEELPIVERVGEGGPDEDAEEEGPDEDGEAEAEGGLAGFLENEEEGPDEVELLFDGEAPEVKDLEGRGDGAGEIGEVGHVLEEEGEDADAAERGLEGSREGGSGEEDKEGEEIEGKDAEGAAGVEVAGPVGFAEGVPEDAGDEEAGEDEEEGDAGPAGFEDLGLEADEGVGRAVAAAVVEKNDGEDGEAANSIEGGDMLLVAGGEGVGVAESAGTWMGFSDRGGVKAHGGSLAA